MSPKPWIIAAVLFGGVLADQAPCPAMPSTTAQGVPDSIRLTKMLARRITVNLKTSTLRQIFSKMAGTARIPIDVQQRAYQLLPLGKQTQISAQFQGVSVETALNTILGELALRVRRVGGRLVIIPSDELLRIGRRATWSELNLLRQLHGLMVTAVDANWPAGLRPQLQPVLPPLRLPVVSAAMQVQAISAVRRSLPATAAQALNIYARALHRIWYVHHDRILITTTHHWVRRQLQRPVFLHAANAPLQTVLTKLSRATGVRLIPAPGLYLAIPTVSVDSNGGSADQTLDALSGATGIVWHIQGDHLLIAPPRTLDAIGPQSGDPIVGMIRIPLAGAMHLNLFLRKSQLPEGLQKRLTAQLQHDLVVLAKMPPVKNGPASRP